MSTFTSPESATSGLQGYDLEGAKRGKKEPGKSDVIATLYIKRRVRNADEIIAWAKANGFPTTLPADDMHVTIAYSKKELAWKNVEWSTTPVMRAVGGTRTMKRLGKEGEAVVLGITSDALNRRHYDIRAAGAAWAWPSYQPHITISYDAADVDLDKITPFDGMIEFGPEEWAPVKANYMDTIVEKAALRAAGVAFIHDGKALFLRRAAGGDHGGEWNFPGGGIEPGETPQQAAVRETLEEAGYAVPGGADNLSFIVCAAGEAVNYSTFAMALDAPFTPILNDEHDAFVWAPLDQPPAPLHPGMRAILPLVISAANATAKAATAALVKGAGQQPAVNREEPMDNLNLFVQLRKVDAKERIVYGTAVVEEVDRAGEIFDYATSKPNFEKWSEGIAKSTDGKSLGNVRAMHGNVAAGKLVDIGFDDARKAIDVAAKIVDDNEWKKVEEGVYTGFSIGGKYSKRWADGANKRYTAVPAEVSLVDLPCGPSAQFSMIKADGSEEMRKFAAPADEAKPAEITNEMVAKRATDLALAAGDAGAWLSHIELARKELEVEAAKAVEAATLAKAAESETTVVETADATVTVEGNGDVVIKAAEVTLTVDADAKAAEEAAAAAAVEKAAADDAAKTTADDIAQVWASKRLPGQTFAKKADLSTALIQLDAKEEAEKAVADVLGKGETGYVSVGAVNDDDGDDAKKIQKNTSATTKYRVGDSVKVRPGRDHDGMGKGKVGRVQKVSTPALGVTFDGMAMHKWYTDDEVEGITLDKSAAVDRDALVKAVAEFVPSNTNAAARRDLFKQARTLKAFDVLPEGWVEKVAEGSDLAKYANVHFVSDLMCMLGCVQTMEARAEMDSEYAVSLPKELTDRFGAALVELGDISAAVLDIVLAAMKAEQVTEARKSAELVELIKRGARNSANDKGLIKTAHDALASLDKDVCGGGMDKAAPSEDLAKAAGEIAELRIRLDATKAANVEALSGVKSDIEEKVAKITTLTGEVEALKKRNEELEKMADMAKQVAQFRLQPASTPFGTFRTVEKTIDISPDFSKVTDDELRQRAATAAISRQQGR